MAWHKLGRFKEGAQNLHELHVVNVYADEEFIKEVNTSTDEEALNELAIKYAISREEITWYLSRNYTNRDGQLYRRKIKPFRAVDREDETLTLQFDRNITKEDYLEAWNQWFSPSRKNATQPKLPTHQKLLYAIFKAREHQGKTFRQIFEDYENGTLPGYSGSSAMFSNNQKKLEEYYRKYKVK